MWSDYWNSGCIQILRPFGPQDDIGGDGGWNGIVVMMIPVGLGDDYGENTFKWEEYERKYV